MSQNTLNRRTFLAATGAGALSLSLSCTEKSGVDRRPNIVLCMTDDQGWGDVGYNGHPVLKTPNLDDLAASGLRFDHFYAAAPVCSPTRASIMTGRHPNRMGCYWWGYPLRPQEVTLAQVLRDAGYVTGHFGKWHLGSAFAGSPVNPGACGFDTWFSRLNFFDLNPIFSREGRAEQYQGEGSAIVAETAIDFMREHAEGDKPFFAVVWFASPHNPYAALPEDRERYAAEPKDMRNYLAEITALDRAVGTLRTALRDMGVAHNTLFWYCSDNGGVKKKSVTGGRGHKGEIYEGGLRVPAVVEWPARIPEPRSTNQACVTSDIYPTVLEAAGATVAKQPPLDGLSLLSLLTDATAPPQQREIGFWKYPARGVGDSDPKWMRALLENQQKGIETPPEVGMYLDAGEISNKLAADTRLGHAAWNAWPWKLHRMEDKQGKVTVELYHLENDPMEKNNRLGSEPRLAEAMMTQLETWQASVVRSQNGEDY